MADFGNPPERVTQSIPYEGQASLSMLDEGARITPPQRDRFERPLTDATPFVMPLDLSQLAPREWLYGHTYLRKYVTVTVAPGGVGKSTLTASEALALVTGKPLLGQHVPFAQRVWIINLEDAPEDLIKSISAAMRHHKIGAEDIGDRLFVDSGRIQSLILADQGKEGAMIREDVRNRVIEIMKNREIDVLMIDPFVSSHRANENDNNAIDMIAKEWGFIAQEANAAIHIVHHVRKQGADAEVTTDSSRGAKSLTDAARITRVLNRMTEDEASRASVDSSRLYFSAHIDKGNFSPPADKRDWYTLVSVDLRNGNEVFASDSIGVAESWEWVSDEVLEPQTALEIQKRVAKEDWRKDVRAKALWLGNLVADVTGLSVSSDDEREEIKSIIHLMFERGLLGVEKRKDKYRKDREFVVVGEWQTLQMEVFE